MNGRVGCVSLKARTPLSAIWKKGLSRVWDCGICKTDRFARSMLRRFGSKLGFKKGLGIS